MYSRLIKEPPVQIIENGKAHFGTFMAPTAKIDIRGMRAPYAGIPLPNIISNLRIKSRLNYFFTLENFFGLVEFLDFKIIGISQIILWNKTNGKRYVYHSIMPARRRFVPTTSTRGICASYRKSRFIKISWGRKHQHHALTFKVHGRNIRPDIQGYVYSPMEDSMHKDLLFVNPSPSSSRCSATWFTSMSVKGELSINNKQVEDSQGLAAMLLNRTYYKFRSKTTIACAMGNIKNKNIIFCLKSSNMDAADSDTYNDNILIVDGKETVLPPVYITHSFGVEYDWVIQDTESMIDLNFKPVSVATRTMNIIGLRSFRNCVFGFFEGALLTKDGEKISLKDFPAVLFENSVRL